MENLFGERIKALRVKADLTQKSLAEKLEISSASVIAYEKGQKTPSIYVAIKFANYFGVSLDALCGTNRTGGQFKSNGDIARTLHAILKTRRFQLSVRSVIDRDMDANDEVAEIIPSGCWDEYGEYLAPPLNEFLVRYNKMARLLYENTLSQEIFDTWIESEFLKLDRWVGEAATNADET